MNKSQNTHNDLGAEEIVTNKFGLDPKIPSKSSLINWSSLYHQFKKIKKKHEVQVKQ